MSKTCTYCGSALMEDAKFCTHCGRAVNTVSPQEMEQSRERKNPSRDYSQKMGWYKFIIYVQLFLSAVFNVVYAIMYLTGLQYGGTDMATRIYYYYPGMKLWDMMMTVVCLAMAVLCIIVRRKLKKFRKNAPYQYYGILIINIAVSLVYLLAAAHVLGVGLTDLLSGNTVISWGVSGVMLIINVIYFNHRMFMFGDSGDPVSSGQQSDQSGSSSEP